LVAVLNAGIGLINDQWSVGGGLAIIFWPIAAVMGVPWDEIPTLAELLGTKIALTELVAYKQLGALMDPPGDLPSQISPRTALIASFALCGFANIGSVAIQVGGLGAMAPSRRADLAKLGLRAMFAGALATCMTACVAGVLSA
jgi:CNT family concentrative nucleoside transporter